MKNNALLFATIVICLLLSSSLLGQKTRTKIKFGAPTPVIDGMKYYFKYNGGFYAVKKRHKTIYLQKIDPEIPKIIKTKKIENGIDKYMSLSNIKQVGDKFYIFMGQSKRNSKRAKLDKIGCSLLYKEIDFETMTLSETKTLLYTPTKIYGGYEYYFSEDKTKLLIQYDLPKEKRNDEDSYLRLRLFVFSSDLEQLSGGEIRMPFTEAEAKIENYVVSNDGTSGVQVFMKGKEEGKGKNKVKESDHLGMIFFDQEKKSSKVHKCKVPKHSGPNAIFYQDKADNWIILSTKENPEDESYTIIFQDIDDKEPFKEYKLPIKMGSFGGITTKYGALDEHSSFYVHERIDCPNNGVVLVLQERLHWNYKIFNHKTKNFVDIIRTDYGDLILVKLDDNTEVEWTQKLNHTENYYNKYYDAYFSYALDENRLHIQKMNPRKPKSNKAMAIYNYDHYAVDLASGEFKKTYMYSSSKMGKYEPRQIYNFQYLGDNTFLMEIYKGEKEDVLARLKIVEEE